MNGETPFFNSGIGPGSRTEDDQLSYMPMPHEMHTFAIPVLPESEELGEYPETLELLERVQAELDGYKAGEPGRAVELACLPEPGLALLNQILGEGEVAVQVCGAQPVRIQETVLAGVWWGQQLDEQGIIVRQWLEIADVPALVLQQAFADARWPQLQAAAMPADLLNAGPVLAELLDAAQRHAEAGLGMARVVNLSLLPFSPEDHRFLAEQLGDGAVVMLSRGYGSCRIASTATPGIWRVQYFNSTDQLILDTLEVTTIPQVACAAQEDVEDSSERLREIRAVLI
ncbi:hydrogenase expression/formation protein [Azomonas macrocytogenes]|uniref:Hydrogenase-1 operon protein HyaF n=1 Tax=Azomonas macrocytogenes TaxID=69962 RepID=A0A839T8N2_AZOMA|nr:hydrogenase expression/formation protein [Azomonas macrocytogenes]MBB3104816.1 hydrogenase-1 operon protein HyaF [Azomonas macrocytogenes]